MAKKRRAGSQRASDVGPTLPGFPDPRTKAELIAEIDGMRRTSEAAAISNLAIHRREMQSQDEQLIEIQTLLDQSQDWFAELFDFAPIPYIALDQSGVVGNVNFSTATLLETERASIVNVPLQQYVAMQDRGRFQDHMQRCCAEPGHCVTALTLQTGRGQFVPAELVTRKAGSTNPEGYGYLTTITDLRERIEHEKARNLLIQQLLDSQESERRRISRELHDHTGQHITALIIGLRILQQRLEGDPAAVQDLNGLLKIADNLGRDTHRLALNLRPTALDDLGLQSALRHYLDDWSQHTKIQIDFHCTLDDRHRLARPIETALYRIIQEAMTNIVKHAQATRASVVVRSDREFVHATIEDDGAGFDAPARQDAARGRLGLIGMEERVVLLDGSFEVESKAGAGTTILVRIPLREHKETDHDGATSGISR